MECFHCKKELESREDWFCIWRKSNKGYNLHFHVDCFESIAGTEYISELKSDSKKCIQCSSLLFSGEGILCSTCCTKINLTCPKCQSLMTLRINKRNNSTFFGCLRYPACKGTKSITGFFKT